MPFLFYHNQSFTLVSHKSKQGLFYQNYTQKGFSRPFMLHNYPTTVYASAIDPSGTLHIVSQTSKSQITYFKIQEAQVTKQLILEDTKNIYSFSDLALHFLQGQLYLFYTALHPDTSTRSLLCQILSRDAQIFTVIPTLSTEPALGIYQIGDTLSILHLAKESSYTLHHTMMDTHTHTEQLLTSNLPLSHFNICRHGNDLHLLYILDNFGRSQLVYVNPKRNVPIVLKTSAAIQNPCIFYYLNYIWITYMENNVLYGLLSLDDGATFSTPIRCSFQSNLDCYQFMSDNPSLINGSSLWAGLLNTIRIPIVSNLDVTGIHPDLSPNTELELLIDGI
ncbi:MAG: hypothetical protein ACRCTE_04980, partial [Cellulosilyticaceae bacterium]